MLRLSVTGVPDAWDKGGRPELSFIELFLSFMLQLEEAPASFATATWVRSFRLDGAFLARLARASVPFSAAARHSAGDTIRSIATKLNPATEMVAGLDT